MTWKPRPIEPDEMRAAADLLSTVFVEGPRASDDFRRQHELLTEADRTFALHDGDLLVGTAAAYSFALAVPGGGTLPLCAISNIGVAPTHRRRGMLRALMEVVVDQALERDEPIAGLTASEATIYRRFGFGVGARLQSLAVDRARAEPTLAPTPAVGGRFRLLTEAEAAAVLPAVWERHWRRVPGELGRNAAWWPFRAVDPEADRDGATARHIVAHEDAAGEPDGYALYRMTYENDTVGLRVGEVAAADDATEAALERYLLDVDLVRTITWFGAPLDHALRWRLADPRALRVTAELDHLWLRPLDVARCLAARRYGTAGGLVIEVVDDYRPELGGRFRLDAGPGGADCARTGADPDLVVAAPELASLLLGGVAWGTLRRAGLVDERTRGAVARADLLFRPDRLPFCGTPF